MGLKFNPLIYSGLDLAGSGGGPSPGTTAIGDPVDTAGDLPVTAPDGQIRVVKDTDSIYVFDETTNTWIQVTSPSTDLGELSYTGSDESNFTDIPGFVFIDTVSGFDALIEVVKDTGEREVIKLHATRTSNVPVRTFNSTGEITSVDFNVVENINNELQVQYKTDVGPNTYTFKFRAITVN